MVTDDNFEVGLSRCLTGNLGEDGYSKRVGNSKSYWDIITRLKRVMRLILTEIPRSALTNISLTEIPSTNDIKGFESCHG